MPRKEVEGERRHTAGVAVTPADTVEAVGMPRLAAVPATAAAEVAEAKAVGVVTAVDIDKVQII